MHFDVDLFLMAGRLLWNEAILNSWADWRSILPKLLSFPGKVVDFSMKLKSIFYFKVQSLVSSCTHVGGMRLMNYNLLGWRCQQVLFWGWNRTHCCTSFSKCTFTNEGKYHYIQQQCPQGLQYFWVESSYPVERRGAWGCWSSWIWPDWVGGAGKSCDLLLLCTCSYSQPSNPMCVKRLWVHVHCVWTCTTLFVLTMYSVSGYTEISVCL